MYLILISLLSGFVGAFIGAAFGNSDFWVCALALFGVISPSLYVLEKIYDKSKDSDIGYSKVNHEVLESLRSSNILEDDKYQLAYEKLKEINDISENKLKYQEGLEILYQLSQVEVLSESEYIDKVDKLKSLYEQ